MGSVFLNGLTHSEIITDIMEKTMSHLQSHSSGMNITSHTTLMLFSNGNRTILLWAHIAFTSCCVLFVLINLL